MNCKPTLLYVDDEKANTLLFKINFRDCFDLVVANSGQEALGILENNRDISVVISDLRMPGMTGLEFILEANKQYSELQYFILSGIEAAEEFKPYLDSKILSGYFSKPVSFDYIKEELKNLNVLKS